MTTTLNRSEQFVYNACRKSFLSMWSFSNPRGKRPDKELCDILVICSPHVIVISVKECEFKGAQFADVPVEQDCKKYDEVEDDTRYKNDPYKIACDRWTRNAVDESIRQINGAIRILDKTDTVIQKDGTPCLPLPPMDKRVYHRIAIAIGAKGKVPLTSSINDGVMVQVWDEVTFWHVMGYLNTITDFTEYLFAKKIFFESQEHLMVITEGEEHLLAFYLSCNGSFPKKTDCLIIEAGCWSRLKKKPEFRQKIEADKISYIWDDLIETVVSRGCVPQHTKSVGGASIEHALRTMVKESRFARRILSHALQEFLQSAKNGVGRARLCRSLSQTNYVFFVYDQESTITARQSELYCRCVAAVSVLPDSQIIVGIGLNIPGSPPVEGSNVILCQISCEGAWPNQFLAQSLEIREKCGYFNGTMRTVSQDNEFPARKA